MQSDRTGSTIPTYRCLDGVSRPYQVTQHAGVDFDLILAGVVERGHGHASGQNRNSPYAGGTLRLQYPLFKQMGLDLGACFPGTLNVSIAPKTYRLRCPSHAFEEVAWFPDRRTENFAFCRCQLTAAGLQVAGYVYYPDPATKTRHYDNPSHLQIIAPYLPGLAYGDWVTLALNSDEIVIEG